jgi:methyl coenzyme M reductase subunit C
LKKLNTTHDPLRLDKSNGLSSSVVVTTAGAGCPSSGESALSDGFGLAPTNTHSKHTSTMPTTVAAIGATGFVFFSLNIVATY